MKICTKCKVEKPFEAFWKSKGSADGLQHTCIECIKLRRLERKNNPLMQLEKQIISSIRLENKLLKRENKKLCTECKEIFLIDDLSGGIICKDCNAKKAKEYYENNKEKVNKHRIEYYEKNKEKIKEYTREHYEKNKEKINEARKEYFKKYREKNTEYREKNKEKTKEYKKEYRLKNKEKIREYDKQYRLKKKLEKQKNT